jgi:penicillin-binding protein 1A
MTGLLQNVINNGTGKRIRSYGYTGFAAGKTGTTNNFRDAWFVGFNDRYTSSVWVGYDQPTVSLGPGQAGGVISAPIWAEFQKKIERFRSKEEPFINLSGYVEIEYCQETQKPSTPDCLNKYMERFITGTESIIDNEVQSDNENIIDTPSEKKPVQTDDQLQEDIY